ncbi:MAG: dynamin family protein [Vibrio sp.]
MNHNKASYSQEIERFLQEMGAVSEKVGQDERYLDSDLVTKLHKSVQTLRPELENEHDKNRLLRVGIIGSVKAGKSTFLNALLFNGESILPEAPTPMTASLTLLRHTDDNQSVRFVYYSREDWQQIEEEAAKARSQVISAVQREKKKHQERFSREVYDEFNEAKAYQTELSRLSQERQACCELCDNAKKHIGNPYQILDKKDEFFAVENIKDVASLIKSYIGSNGKYTSVVRHVELNINCEMLHDLEIVDTPGLNDPVVSRSQETLKSLAQCDSVFLLSRTSAFLPEADLRLLKGKTLFQEGIKHKVIVASQIDSGVLDHKPNKIDFRTAYRKSGQAAFNRLRKVYPDFKGNPIPVSAILSSCAYKKQNNLELDSREKQVTKQLAKYQGAPTSAQELQQFSNINSIRKELDITRLKKDEIKSARQMDLLKGRRDLFCDTLLTLEKTAVSNSRLLKDQDIDSLRKQSELIKAGMKAINSKLSSLFINTNTEVKNHIAVLKNRVIKDISNYENLRVEEKHSAEDKSYETGFIFKDKHYYTVEKTDYIASVADAIGILRRYVSTEIGHINRTFNEILPIEQLKVQVKTHVLNLYNSAGIDFDEDSILLPLKATLGQLTVPKFEFDNDQLNDELISSFSSETVKNEEIYRLKLKLEQSLQNCGKTLVDELERHQQLLARALKSHSDGFVQNIINETEKHLNKVTELMQDRENNLIKYEKVIEGLREYRNAMISFEVQGHG